MQGTRHDPGFVQRTLEDVFEHVAAQPEREFLLGLSIMEIYNEVQAQVHHCSRLAATSPRCSREPHHFSGVG